MNDFVSPLFSLNFISIAFAMRCAEKITVQLSFFFFNKWTDLSWMEMSFVADFFLCCSFSLSFKLKCWRDNDFVYVINHSSASMRTQLLKVNYGNFLQNAVLYLVSLCFFFSFGHSLLSLEIIQRLNYIDFMQLCIKWSIFYFFSFLLFVSFVSLSRIFFFKSQKNKLWFCDNVWFRW